MHTKKGGTYAFCAGLLTLFCGVWGTEQPTLKALNEFIYISVLKW